MSGRSRPSASSGFTLLEVLVALFISALVLTGLGTAMKSVTRAWHVVTNGINRRDSLAAGLAVVTRDVSLIERVSTGISDRPTISFRGLPSDMEFVVAESGSMGVLGLYWIRLSSRGEVLRTRAPFVAGQSLESRAWRDEVAVMERGVDVRFSYGVGPPAAQIWREAWTSVSTMPERVRLEVVDSASGARLLPAIVQDLKIDLDPGCAEGVERYCSTPRAKAEGAGDSG